MRSLLIIGACSIAVGLVGLVVRTCTVERPTRDVGMALDSPDDPFGVARRAELEAYRHHLLWQIEQADTIADELIAGRTTLAAAVDRLAEINRNRSELVLTSLRQYHGRPAAGERELYARYTLTKVQNRLGGNAARLAEVAPRLNKEFRELVSTDEEVLKTEEPDPAPVPARAWRGYAPGQVRCE